MKKNIVMVNVVKLIEKASLSAVDSASLFLLYQPERPHEASIDKLRNKTKKID